MFCSTFDDDAVFPGGGHLRSGNLFATGEVACSEVVGFQQLLRSAAEYHFAAVNSGAGPHVYQVIGSAHDFFVVFHDNHRVALVTQLFEHHNQALSIAWVQANARLVQDVHGAHQRAAQRGSQVDALRLTARQGRREAVEGEVFQPHITQILQAIADLKQQVLANVLFALIKRELGHERAQLTNRHEHQVDDGMSVDLDV